MTMLFKSGQLKRWVKKKYCPIFNGESAAAAKVSFKAWQIQGKCGVCFFIGVIEIGL